MPDLASLSQRITEWLRDEVQRAGCRGLVLGLSGGLDSSVTALLCSRALPENTLGLIMPCESISRDKEHAMLLIREFSLQYREVDLSTTYRSLLNVLDDEGEGLKAANIKPRLRMTTLYYFAHQQDYLVVGTGNRSELAVGYFTKHGDGGVDLLPLGRLLKSEVRELAQYLGVPETIINKEPSAGLWEGQRDEEEMGLTYRQLDGYLEGEEVGEEVKHQVLGMMNSSRHKKRPPLIFEP